MSAPLPTPRVLAVNEGMGIRLVEVAHLDAEGRCLDCGGTGVVRAIVTALTDCDLDTCPLCRGTGVCS